MTEDQKSQRELLSNPCSKRIAHLYLFFSRMNRNYFSPEANSTYLTPFMSITRNLFLYHICIAPLQPTTTNPCHFSICPNHDEYYYFPFGKSLKQFGKVENVCFLPWPTCKENRKFAANACARICENC